MIALYISSWAALVFEFIDEEIFEGDGVQEDMAVLAQVGEH